MVVVQEGWGLTWADDQIWSGMWSWYGISLKSAGWRFASGGKGRRCTVRMQQGAGYEPTATGGLYVAADQHGINCHSPFDHSTAGSLSKGFTSWGGAMGNHHRHTAIRRHSPWDGQCDSSIPRQADEE